MKNKKGFAMAIVVVAMAVVMAISSLILMLLTTNNANQKNQIKTLEQKLFVSEISTAYANKSLGEFVTYCEQKSWAKTGEAPLTLLSTDNSYTIIITQSGSEEEFNFLQTKSQKILALIHKTNNSVVEWHYQIKE